jgi:hypothetical protein
MTPSQLSTEMSQTSRLYRYLGQLLRLSKSASTRGSGLLWAPGGGGDAKTWADVMTAVSQAAAPVPVYFRPSAPGVPGQIPPTPSGAMYDLHGSMLLSEKLGDNSQTIVNMQDGAGLRNLYGLINAIKLVGNPTLGPCLEFDPLPGSPAIVTGQRGGVFQNNGTRAMWDVAPGGFVVPAFIQNGGYVNGTNNAPFIGLGTNAVAFVQAYDVSPEFIGDQLVSGDGTTKVGLAQNGSFFFPSATPLVGFTGAFYNIPLTLLGGSGVTACRPNVPMGFGTLKPGTQYFDTQLATPIPIWWDGAQWFNGAGVGPQ